MYGIGGSNFHDNIEYRQGELMKNREFMDLDQHRHHDQHQQQQQSSGLMRYRSAPSSFFANIIDGSGVGCEDFLSHRSSETETAFATSFMSCNGSGDSYSLDLHSVDERVKNEVAVESVTPQNGYSNGSQIVYQSPSMHALSNHDSVRVMNSMELENPMQMKMSNGNCSNLVRHSSSPAGLFANLTVENGCAVMRDVGNFSSCNGTNDGEANPPASRLNNHINFSSGPSSCSRLFSKMAKMGNEESMGVTSPDNGRLLRNGDGNSRCYMSSFPNDSWDDSAFSGLKRMRENEAKIFSLETQNGDSGNHTLGLTRHFSLPKTSSEMAEKILQFQDSVPCKIRAKRGFATHPRSIAERVRRTRISERMRKLQELFPNMDKQTNTAEMLDLAVEYIKNLQKQVKTLADTRSKCTCSSKQNQYSNATA